MAIAAVRSTKYDTPIEYNISDYVDQLENPISNSVTVQFYWNSTANNLKMMRENQLYLILQNKLQRQFDILRAEYKNIPLSEILDIFTSTSSHLLNLDPDKISVELTYNKSLVFTFKKDEYTYFFEQFIKAEKNEDQVIFSYYEGSQKKPTFSGDFTSAISKMTENLFPIFNRTILRQ